MRRHANELARASPPLCVRLVYWSGRPICDAETLPGVRTSSQSAGMSRLQTRAVSEEGRFVRRGGRLQSCVILHPTVRREGNGEVNARTGEAFARSSSNAT